MADDISAHQPEDDLATLDFSPAGHHDDRSELDALAYAPSDNQDVDDSHGPLFAVTNPPGTVTVTTYLNGRIRHVELSPSVTKLTEAQLAQEIIAVTAIAAIKARAALHTFVAGLLRLQGMDSTAAGDFVERRLSFPTPEQAAAAEAEFITRYGDDCE